LFSIIVTKISEEDVNLTELLSEIKGLLDKENGKNDFVKNNMTSDISFTRWRKTNISLIC